MQGAIARFSIEFEDQLGRTRGSSAADPDLTRARGLLNFPPDVWYFDLQQVAAAVGHVGAEYRAAGRRCWPTTSASLPRAPLRRPDRFARSHAGARGVDLGAQSALIATSICETGLWPIHFDADRLFYQVKGHLYAYYMLLRELGLDFQPVIQPKNNLQNVWDQPMDTFNEAV